MKPNFLLLTLSQWNFLYFQIMAAIINFKTLLETTEHVKLLTDSFHDKQKRTNTHVDMQQTPRTLVPLWLPGMRSKWMNGSRNLLAPNGLVDSNQPPTGGMTAVNVTVFWDVAQSSPVASYQHFVGSWCLHFQSRGALKMKSMYLSKTLVTVYQIIWHQNTEDSSYMSHSCENLESHTMLGIQPILHVMNQWAQCHILYYEYMKKEMCKVQGFVQYNCSHTSVKLCYLGHLGYWSVNNVVVPNSKVL